MNDFRKKLLLNLLCEKIIDFKKIILFYEDKRDIKLDLTDKWILSLRQELDGDIIDQNLNFIIKEAKELVYLNERNIYKDKIRNNQKELFLFNIFSNENNLTKFIPGVINSGINYPISDNESKGINLRKIWNSFEDDLKIILKSIDIEKILILLEKYCSYVPCLDRDNEFIYHISLFQSVKLITAIANNIYNYFDQNYKNDLKERSLQEEINEKDDKRFLLISGDLSGVQDFIYTISSTGALRSLRGRSFYLEMITEKVVRDIIRDFNLTTANIIYSGGGGFYITAPNVENNKSYIEKLQKDINNWLWYEFEGKLFLNIEYEVFCGNNMINNNNDEQYPLETVWYNLSQKIERSKKKKFINNLDSLLKVELPNSLEETCNVCHTDAKEIDKEIKEKGLKTCRSCFDFYEISKYLRQKKYKYIYESKNNCHFKVHNTCYVFSETPSLNSFNYIINSWKAEDWTGINGVQLLLGRYNSGCDDLEDLAQKAEGKKFIAALRMDVDNLGRIFIKGLPSMHKSFINMAFLSRNLSLFFKYYINFICKGQFGRTVHYIDTNTTNPKRNVDIIYSGGDDLFILGTWNQVAELSFDIQDAFYNFFGCNKDLTLSAGVTLHKFNYPVYQIAELSKQAEEEAKDNKGKNSLCMLYNPLWKKKEDFLKELNKRKWGTAYNPRIVQALKWDQAEEGIFRLTQDLNKLDWSNVPHGFFNKLFQVIEVWQRDGALYLPMLHYVVQKIKDLGTISPAFLSKLNAKNMGYFAIPLTWIEYLHSK